MKLRSLFIASFCGHVRGQQTQAREIGFVNQNRHPDLTRSLRGRFKTATKPRAAKGQAIIKAGGLEPSGRQLRWFDYYQIVRSSVA
jgi:hypothetical protein